MPTAVGWVEQDGNGTFNDQNLTQNTSTRRDLLTALAPSNGSTLRTYDPAHDPDFERLKDIANAATLYLLPVIIAVGFLGNSLSLWVLLRTYMRRLSVSVYLASLAASDTIFLVTLMVIWFEHLNIRAFNRQGMCQTTLYLSYSSSFLSVWSVVGFTAERFIAICFPLRRPVMCTPHRAKVVTGCLATAALIIYLPVNWTVDIFQDEKILCLPLLARADLMTSIIYLDLVITFLLPVSVIVAINITVSRKVVLFIRHKERTLTSRDKQHTNRNMKKQITITRSILLISSAYLTINLPSYVMRIKVIVDDFFGQNYQSSKWDFVLQRLAQFFYYTNFAINFLLYSVCSTKFRDALKRPLRQFRANMQKMASYYNYLRARQAGGVHVEVYECSDEPDIEPIPPERSVVMSETRHMEEVPKATAIPRRCNSI